MSDSPRPDLPSLQAAAEATWMREFLAGPTRTHLTELPGEFVIAQGGRITLTHRAQFCEDFPLTEVIIGAIAAARA